MQSFRIFIPKKGLLDSDCGTAKTNKFTTIFLGDQIENVALNFQGL